jgi:hypothetical protein
VAVALRGRSLMTAISPNTSPALTTSSARPPIVSATSPSTMKYMRLADFIEKSPPFDALSSSAKSTCPAEKRSGFPEARKSCSAMAAL